MSYKISQKKKRKISFVTDGFYGYSVLVTNIKPPFLLQNRPASLSTKITFQQYILSIMDV